MAHNITLWRVELHWLTIVCRTLSSVVRENNHGETRETSQFHFRQWGMDHLSLLVHSMLKVASLDLLVHRKSIVAPMAIFHSTALWLITAFSSIWTMPQLFHLGIIHNESIYNSLADLFCVGSGILLSKTLCSYLINLLLYLPTTPLTNSQHLKSAIKHVYGWQWQLFQGQSLDLGTFLFFDYMG